MSARLKAFLVLAVITVAGLGLTLAAPLAEAASSYTWTSTADFDAGTKQDPGSPWFAENGIDQPMNWACYPSAVFDNGRTYVVWQGDAGFVPYIAAYTHATNSWEGPVRIAATNPISGDGHGAPAIVIDADGYIHVFYGSHSSSQEYAKSSSPRNINAWTAMTDLDNSATYPHPVLMANGTIYVLYRAGTLPTASYVLRFSTNGGVSWSSERAFIQFSIGSPYVGNVVRSGNRLYFSFDYVAGADVRHSLYAAYFDAAQGKVFSIGDTDLGTVMDLTEANASARIESTAGPPLWEIHSGALRLDSSNNPYLIYQSGVGSTNWRHNFTRWTGAAWSASETIQTTDAVVSNEGDFILRSSTDLEAYLIGPGFSGQGGDLRRYTWNGVTWTLAETILSQGVASIGLSAPMVPENYHDDIRVVWNTRRVSLVVWYERMYAWGGRGFVNDTRDPYPQLVETSTDSSGVTAGQVVLSSGRGDTFTVTDADANVTKWNRVQRVASGQESTSRCGSLSFAGGELNVSVTTANHVECGISSTFTLSGNFDVRIKTSTPVDGSNRAWNLCLYDHSTECNNGIALASDTDGFWYRSLIDDLLAAFNVSAGTATQIGTNTNLAGVATDPICLRITRSTNTFEFHYATTSACSSWTLDESHTRLDAPSSFYLIITYTNNGATDGIGTIDDYVLSAGTVDSGGYRTSGSWTSPTTSGGKVERVSLTHSGLSATAYIDKVEILDGGSVVETFGTDITSGTSTTLTPTNAFRESPQVRVTLAGNGAGTPILESVEVELTAGGGSLLDRPAVDFTWEYSALGCEVRFFDRSTSSLNVTGRLWDFGDDTTSTERDPVHFFAGCSPLRNEYRVTLRITLEDEQVWYAIRPVSVDRVPLVLMFLLAVLAWSVARAAQGRRAELRTILRSLRR